MPSTFTWLDYSEQQRRQVLDIIDRFQESDTRDELGLGTVRDAFSDRLFPGTSTIQTRARYFFFIPWIYRELERAQVPAREAAGRAHRDEVLLIEGLTRSDDRQGVIGIEARANLKRLPSTVYWQGLRRWGIRLYPGSQDQYFRSLDAFYVARGQAGNAEESSLDRPHNHWHPGLPPRPEGFPRLASFQLTPEEAGYLHDRILAAAPGSLLAALVALDDGAADVPLPWLHPALPDLPARLRGEVEHARNFSELLHGAPLLYNLMLAELERPEQEPDYLDLLTDWYAALGVRSEAIARWDRRAFWALAMGINPRIALTTRDFIDTWVERVQAALSEDRPLEHLLGDPQVRRRIADREVALKGSLARLHNKHAREQWEGFAGTTQLNFRWPTAYRLLKDIQAGRKGETGSA